MNGGLFFLFGNGEWENRLMWIGWNMIPPTLELD